ncbi:hypothetical protein GCM10028857_15040 [Salinarchaeum chitinilyticum]
MPWNHVTGAGRTGVVFRSESNGEVMSSSASDVDEDFMRRSAKIATLWLGIIVAAGIGLVVFSDAFLSTFA